MSKTKVIAFANNKGGSGKTTTCSNVACAMAMQGKKVLIIDGDMQLNLTISYFDEESALAFAENGTNIYFSGYDLAMVTCNDSTSKSVTVTYWNLI